jgi:hypothetical protein
MLVHRQPLVAAILLCFAGFAACQRAEAPSQKATVASEKPGRSIVGKWQEEHARESIEFTADGNYSGNMLYGMSQTPRDVSGTYFTANDQISLTPKESSYPMTWKFQFLDDGGLVLTFVQGGEVKIDGTMAKYHTAP